MRTQIKNLSLIVALAGFAALPFIIAPVSGETGNQELQQNNVVKVAHSDMSTWSERRTNFVKPVKSELKKKLTKLQYDVTQEDSTERPFQNEYWDNKKEGIYVDIVSGEPLFSSTDKYRSGTGWPSFTRPIVNDALVEKTDLSFFGIRTELRSALADSHVGHVFEDGPQPAGLRYCINSASLRFIEKDKLATEGYSEFLSLFNK